MNLLYFTTAYEPGIFGNRVHEEFLDRMRAYGYTPRVLVPDQQARGSQRLRITAGDVPVVRAAVSNTRLARAQNRLAGPIFHYDQFLTTLAAYRAYLRAHPAVDIVHVESMYPLGALAALAGGPPYIPTIRGGDLIADDAIGYGFARYRSVRLLLRIGFRRAAAVRAVSPGARAMAIEYGCDPAKIVTVPRNIRDDCFIDQLPAFRATSRAAIDARHGTAGQQLLVSAGRLLPVKGFDDLARALPALLARVPDARVLVLGPNRDDSRLGDYAAYLNRLAAALGVAERFTLVGHIAPAGMAEYLAAADAVAVPSLIEGGNKILVEGAALGTPFVATETAGTVGFFDTAQALVVPPRDPAALAAALGELLADPQQRAARGAACVATRDRFRAAAVARAMDTVYRDAVAQHASSALAPGARR